MNSKDITNFKVSVSLLPRNFFAAKCGNKSIRSSYQSADIRWIVTRGFSFLWVVYVLL